MRKSFLLLTLVSCLLTTAAAPPFRPAPEFVIQKTNGQQLLLSSYRGKSVVLALMYATCSHCQHTAGLLNQIQKDYASKDVQVLGATFNDGDAQRIDQFVQHFQIMFPCGYSSVPAVLTFLQQPQGEPYYVPILVFIDKKGIIRKQVIGDEKFLNEKDQPANIRAEVEKLVKGSTGQSTSMKSKRSPKS